MILQEGTPLGVVVTVEQGVPDTAAGRLFNQRLNGQLKQMLVEMLAGMARSKDVLVAFHREDLDFERPSADMGDVHVVFYVDTMQFPLIEHLTGPSAADAAKVLYGPVKMAVDQALDNGRDNSVSVQFISIGSGAVVSTDDD